MQKQYEKFEQKYSVAVIGDKDIFNAKIMYQSTVMYGQKSFDIVKNALREHESLMGDNSFIALGIKRVW